MADRRDQHRILCFPHWVHTRTGFTCTCVRVENLVCRVAGHQGRSQGPLPSTSTWCAQGCRPGVLVCFLGPFILSCGRHRRSPGGHSEADLSPQQGSSQSLLVTAPLGSSSSLEQSEVLIILKPGTLNSVLRKQAFFSPESGVGSGSGGTEECAGLAPS